MKKIGLAPRPIVILATFLLGCWAFFNFFLRTGFTGSYAYEVTLLGGLGFFLVLGPYTIIFNQKSEYWYKQASIIALGLLLLMCLIGYLKPGPLVPGIFSGLGYTLLLIQFRQPIRSRGWTMVGYGFLAFLFSVWTVSVIWGGYHLRPTFLETLAVSGPYFVNNEFYNADMLYHLSIGQMLKHYNVPSTGLDGLPMIYYHYGSHWMMAQLSWFTGLPLVIVYNYGYPLIIVPLFFSAFYQFITFVQETLFGRSGINLVFVLIGMCLFIQVPGHLYAGGLLGISGLVNDSFILSLILLFAVGQASLVYWRSRTDSSWIFFLWLMVMTGAASMVKISTGFVLCGMLGYLFLRLKMYQHYKNWVAALGIFSVFMISYWFTSETLPFGLRKIGGDDGIAEPFHFFTSTHDFEPVSWFIGFYFWLYLVFVANVVFSPQQEGSRWVDRWRNNSTLMAEVPLVMAVIGIIPSLLLVFSGGNAMYFSGIQLFVSGALLMAYSQPLEEVVKRKMSKWPLGVSSMMASVLVAGLLLLMYMQVRWHFNRMIQVNVQTRAEILRIGLDPEWRVQYDKTTFGIYEKPVATSYDTMRSGKFLRDMMVLESKSSQHELLYINYRELPPDQFRNIACIETAFIAPALSGHAMLDGLSYQCGIGMYGDGYYRRNFAGTDYPTDSALCALAHFRGKSAVLRFVSESGQVVPLSCGNR